MTETNFSHFSVIISCDQTISNPYICRGLNYTAYEKTFNFGINNSGNIVRLIF